MAKKTSIKDKNVAELTSMLAKQREELRGHRFASAGARPKDSAMQKKTRAEVARILTELHARKIDAAEAPIVETETVA